MQNSRRHDTSYQEYHFDNNVPNCSPVQQKLSIYNWNPGPRRGREGAAEKQIAGKWHVITLQEAIEYVDHELLANRFHVTHYGGCAVLFNKDTFFPDVKVKSIYLHDVRSVLPDKVVDGDSGWIIQGVLSRASFRRQPPGGQISFTVMSLHIKHNFAKKRGIGKKPILTTFAVMLEEHVNVVAGDFNGAAWRRDNSNSISIIEEAFADCALPMPPGRHCGVQERFRVCGQTCVDSSHTRIHMEDGKFVSMVHSPFLTKLWASARPIRAAITRYGSTWILLNGAAFNHITEDTIDDSS